MGHYLKQSAQSQFLNSRLSIVESIYKLADTRSYDDISVSCTLP